MSYEDRCKIVKIKNACFYCVKTGHSHKYYGYKGKCAQCDKRHVFLLCRNTISNAPVKANQEEELFKIKEQSSRFANFSLNSEVFLQTLRVKLFNQGKEQIVRVIFDNGSHRSYILDYYAEKM